MAELQDITADQFTTTLHFEYVLQRRPRLFDRCFCIYYREQRWSQMESLEFDRLRA